MNKMVGIGISPQNAKRKFYPISLLLCFCWDSGGDCMMVWSHCDCSLLSYLAPHTQIAILAFLRL